MVETTDIGDWFRNIPVISRYWFAGSVIFPLLARFGLFHPMSLILTQDFLYRFQIWRPITAVLYYPIVPATGFHYLIHLYFLYSYSTRLETGLFDGRPADYLFMLLFNWTCIVIVGVLMDMSLLMMPLIISVMYLWAQVNRDQIVTFWFGTTFKACYLPWVITGFNFILRGSVMNELVGIFVGHLYFFLMFKYPQDFNGRCFLSTPSFLYRFLPSRRGGMGGFGAPPPPRRRPDDDDGGHGWGGRLGWGIGQRLGEQ
uniref:derlin-1 n=1 Tax=Myxine glutinosa TaxID=7769 RepID=UPI00358EBC48